MKSGFQRSLIMAVLILLVFGGIYQYRGTQKASYSISETEISFTAPSGSEDLADISFLIADITNLSLENLSDLGTCVDGCDTSNCLYGLWESDSLGSYYMSADPDIDVFLIAETDSATYVFNIESANTTTLLYTEILELMAE